MKREKRSRRSFRDTASLSNNLSDKTEYKKAEEYLRKDLERGNLLLDLYEKAPQLSEKQLYDYALDHAVRLTDSEIGFFHIVSDDQKNVILTTWNREALKNCTAAYNTHYPIDSAGNWVDCVHLKRPVIYNDFANSPNQKGLPKGHSPVHRFMSIPVMEGGKVRIIFGVGNKIEEYDDHDVVHIQLVANELQKIIKQRNAEQASRASELKYREIFENVSDSLYLLEVTEDGRFRNLELNRAFEQSTGLPRTQLLGKFIEETVPEETARIVNAKYRGCVEAGTVIDEEVELDIPTGRRTYHSTLIPVRDDSGRIYRIIGISRDMTGRKRSEEALKKSKAGLNEAQHIAHIGSWELDIVNNVLTWSDEIYRIFEIDPEKFGASYEAFLDAIHPDDRETVNFAYTDSLKTRAPYAIDHRLRFADGRIKYVHEQCETFYGADGKPLRSVGTVQDITERKRAEMEITRVNRGLQMLSDTNQAVIHITDEAMLLNETCRIAVDVGGYRMAWVGFAEHDEAKTLRPVAYAGFEVGYIESAKVSWADNERGRGPGGTAIRTGQPCTARNIPLDPAFAPWREAAIQRGYKSIIALPLTSEGQTFGVLGIYSGETDAFDSKEVEILKELAADLALGVTALRTRVKRNQAEEALQESNEIFDQFMKHSPIYVFFKDEKIRSLRLSANYEKMLGRPLNDLLGKTMDELFPSDLAKRMIADDQRILMEGKEIVVEEEFNGRYYTTIKFPIHIEGKPRYLAGYTIDITERRQAEEAVKRSEEEYRHFFEDDLTGDYVSAPDGRILSCNPAFARIFGFESVAEALKSNANALYPEPEDREIFLLLLKERRKLEYYESEFIRCDGSRAYCVENAVGIFDANGSLVQIRGYLFDESRRKSVEQQLVQAQKLESLGTLASGIAHDFNNILGIILGYASLLTRGSSDPENVKHCAEAVVKASNRGAALVKQLLTFARKVDVQVQLVRLNDIVNEISKLLSETFSKTIDIVLDLEKDLPTITGDATQLHQVLLNLCVNARDAMPNGGTISITTCFQEGETIRAKFPRAIAHKYVALRISDNGIGMDKRTQSHIFEPFFTTKGPGKGTGLGLSVVFGVLESHNGFVEVESEPGRGTTFHLYFPVMQRLEFERAIADVQQASPGGRETILVVEDEEMLTRLLRTSLQTAGYTVLIAVDGQEAVDLFDQYQDEIQLVLSDVGLPKLSGYDVFRKLKRTKPNLKFILASGFIEPQLKSEIFKEGVSDFVQKPYSLNEVLKAVRTILDQK